MIFIACSSWGNLSENAANNTNNILIGLATNLLGIIVTVSFVQHFIDRQDEKQERIEEIASIKRYDRLMLILIKKYVMYFNYVITPMEKRAGFNHLDLKTDFLFEDMCDMYVQTLENCDALFKPRITLFYDSEEKLRDYMIRMIENVPFKYNDKLKDCIMNFIEKSLAYDVRGAILDKINNRTADNQKLSEIIQKEIKDPSNKWLEKALNGEHIGFMLPYVKLYNLMQIEIQLIIEYQNYLKNLE
ncbi:hypothetical protein psyc5s11_41900 [Clostridium gelidum]|uniref:Uncharacterized protein n=1 Tax=Clostridium gelidum TaxID=704125 RepID=A0ABM7T9X5_9CLOT|nr:hypothetical protein [Clostridium gelidum]BCZ48123.1 hypothetical protein psyc5s11_41900 [Clostridium gelidum]